MLSASLSPPIIIIIIMVPASEGLATSCFPPILPSLHFLPRSPPSCRYSAGLLVEFLRFLSSSTYSTLSFHSHSLFPLPLSCFCSLSCPPPPPLVQYRLFHLRHSHLHPPPPIAPLVLSFFPLACSHSRHPTSPLLLLLLPFSLLQYLRLSNKAAGSV